MIPSGYKAEKVYSVLPVNGDGDFTFDRTTVATRVNKDGYIETVATDTPRLDYPLIDGVAQDCPSLLLEPARTNSLPYSDDFTWSGWIKGAGGTGSTPVVTANYGISPDGTQNADRLQLNKGAGTTTGALSYIYDTIISVGTGSISIWMKSNDSNNYDIALRHINFTIATVTPEWQRFELNNQASCNEFQLMLRGTYGTSDSADVLIYGAQLEAGSYSTSYIPTSGSAVTRAAETANGAGTSADFNDSEGVLYAEVKSNNDSVNRFISVSDGDASDRVSIVILTNDNIYGQVRAGNSEVFFRETSGIDTETYNKIAVSYKSDETKLFVNGIQVGSTDTSVTMPSGLDTLEFFDGAGNNGLYGSTKELATFKEALTDTELEALTSWDSFNEMATGQLYSIK